MGTAWGTRLSRPREPVTLIRRLQLKSSTERCQLVPAQPRWVNGPQYRTVGFSLLHPRAEYPRGAASIAHTVLGCGAAHGTARADLQTGAEPRDPRMEHRSSFPPRKVTRGPRVGLFLGCPTLTPPAGGPSTESLAGKEGEAASTCTGRKALGGGLGGGYHWDALLACKHNPAADAR